MRIGLLSFEYPPETGFGGIGSYTWYQARALARLGHDVHVLAGSNGQMPLCTVERNGVTVHRYWSGGRAMRIFGALGRWKLWWTRQRLQNGLSMYRALRVLHAEQRFDLLEMPECGAEGLLINSLVEVPTVVRFHSPSRLIMPLYDVKRADVGLCSWLEQRAISQATALTSCSAFLAGEVRSKMGVRAPVQVIPNGIDLKLFDREGTVDVEAKFNLPRGKIKIFFAGRMERRKGIHLCGKIAESILRDYDVAFVFAGQDLFGYMTEVLLPSLNGQPLKGSVHYLGKLGLDDIRSCLKSADIFLLPSLWENLPYSCLEAMAAGRAIVASDQGGVPELIQDGSNGFLATAGDPDSFVAKLRALLDDAMLRQRLGRAARQTVNAKFTDECVAKQSVALYDQVVKTSRRRGISK
jgi:glycogen(starch) synthase